MITAVDTSVLLDIFLPDDQHGEQSKQRLRAAYDAGAIIMCEIVYAELAAMFRDRATLVRELQTVVRHLSQLAEPLGATMPVLGTSIALLVVFLLLLLIGLFLHLASDAFLFVAIASIAGKIHRNRMWFGAFRKRRPKYDDEAIECIYPVQGITIFV